LQPLLQVPVFQGNGSVGVLGLGICFVCLFV